MVKDGDGQSICKSGDIIELANVIKHVYLDPPSQHPYNFHNTPPILYGQIGVPPTVDKILGKLLQNTFRNTELAFNIVYNV